MTDQSCDVSHGPGGNNSDDDDSRPLNPGSLVYSHTSGAAKGAVVLLHGITGTPSEMKGLAEYLNHKGFVVIVPCLSGHGTTIDQLRHTTISDWLRDIDTAFTHSESYNVPAIFAVGLSFGALLAINLAIRTGKVKGIVALSAPFRSRSQLMERILSVLSYLPDPVLNVLGAYDKKKRNPECFALTRSAYHKHSYGALARILAMRRRISRRLHLIHSPVLILQDPFDHHLPPLSSLLLQNGLVSAPSKVYYIPKGEHELTLGHSYELVNSLVSNFLEKLAD